MTTVQEPQTYGRNKNEAKLDFAQGVLNLSNENIQLTMGLLLVDADELASLLAHLAANRARISILVQKIREQVESETERALLDASSARWSAPRNEQPLYALINEQKDGEIGTAITTLMLPLLIDNNSWRAFVQFLQTQLFTQGDEEQKQKTYRRTHDFIRANQKLQSTVAEGKRTEEQLSQLGSIIESSSDAIIIHTLDGIIVNWNRGAESVYGYSAREVLGRPRNLLV